MQHLQSTKGEIRFSHAYIGVRTVQVISRCLPVSVILLRALSLSHTQHTRMFPLSRPLSLSPSLSLPLPPPPPSPSPLSGSLCVLRLASCQQSWCPLRWCTRVWRVCARVVGGRGCLTCSGRPNLRACLWQTIVLTMPSCHLLCQATNTASAQHTVPVRIPTSNGNMVQKKFANVVDVDQTSTITNIGMLTKATRASAQRDKGRFFFSGEGVCDSVFPSQSRERVRIKRPNPTVFFLMGVARTWDVPVGSGRMQALHSVLCEPTARAPNAVRVQDSQAPHAHCDVHTMPRLVS